MGMRLEKWLDRRVVVKDGEAALSGDARERLFQRDKGPVPVPKGIIEDLGNTKYSVSPPGELYHSTIMKESEIASDMQVADGKTLGERGNKYDSVFDELRQPGVEERYRRIQKKAHRYRFAGAMAIAATIGALWSAAELPFPVVNFTNANSCEFEVGVNQYIEPAESMNPQVAKNLDTCKVADREYVIQNVNQK